MKSREELISHSEYTKRIRNELPREAFAAAPRKLWMLSVHLFLVAGGYAGFRFTSSLASYAILTLIIGHSLACIAFLAHELSHNTIVRSRRLRYGLEVFFWALNVIPATVWRRVHNHTHHHHASTPQDPDRQFLESEKFVLTRWYSRLFYPHRNTVRWNPLVAFHFVPYIVKNIVAAFFPNSKKPSVVPHKPDYSVKQRLNVAAELLVIVAVQTGIFHAVGASWSTYLWASPAVILIASGVVMAYVFTNHFLSPLGEINDPLSGSTSVIVSPVYDRLHTNFSYHTEHHLFPQVNSDYYPQVSALLQKHYADRYHRIPIGKAWNTLWTGEEFAPDGTGDFSSPSSSAILSKETQETVDASHPSSGGSLARA